MANVNTNYIMNLLFDNDIFYFQPKQLSTILKIDIKTVYDIIQRLKNKDVIKEIERGEFISVSQRDWFLVLVFEAKEKDICQQLTQNILGKLKEVY